MEVLDFTNERLKKMSKNDLFESILKLREEKEKFSISESTKDIINDMVSGIHSKLKAIREEYIKCKEDNVNLKASIEEMKSNYVDKKNSAIRKSSI